jgi:hypothetical protein
LRWSGRGVCVVGGGVFDPGDGFAPGGAGFFAAGSFASVAVPSEPVLASEPVPTPGAVTVPAGADVLGEEDVPEGSSRLSFGTRCSPRCNRRT